MAPSTPTPLRRSNQRVALLHAPPGEGYSLYPSFPIPAGAVEVGFNALAARLAHAPAVRVDGYIGVAWEDFRGRLAESFAAIGRRVAWVDVETVLKPAAEVEALIGPSLGGDDPLFGTRFLGALGDFFDVERLAALHPRDDAETTILYGCGASLASWDGPLVYVDLPKNELQYRSRAGGVRNLGQRQAPASPQAQYKRLYFVDWPALNGQKETIVERVDWFVDGQHPETPPFVAGDTVRDALDQMSRGVFRPRPWFEPGPWGGQWLKRELSDLPQDEPNYAWSFELISPENGLTLSDGRTLCELSFDWLMHHRAAAVLGPRGERFGNSFPIRFDFLDTVDGGNLSLQCHPRPEYIRRHFGESFTQDETYYIVDCSPGAEVYLGFRDDVQPSDFRGELERSLAESAPVDVKRHVSTTPARRHDLFLIPSGTVHCSGAGNLVLEISATPYIFTFKMYDWLRLGLDGKPRPLNIARAFENLQFDRRGDYVAEKLVSHQRTVAEGPDWRLVHAPTHAEHFYDVHRYEFDSTVSVETQGSVHVAMLVEGTEVRVEPENGPVQTFHFVETFVVSAAAGRYKLVNTSGRTAKVVVAFLKPHLEQGS